MKTRDNFIVNSVPHSEKNSSPATQNITRLRSNTITETIQVKPENNSISNSVLHSEAIQVKPELKIEAETKTEAENEDNSSTKSIDQLITHLVNMGFENRSTNLQILKKHNGNLVKAVTELMSLM